MTRWLGQRREAAPSCESALWFDVGNHAPHSPGAGEDFRFHCTRGWVREWAIDAALEEDENNLGASRRKEKTREMKKERKKKETNRGRKREKEIGDGEQK